MEYIIRGQVYVSSLLHAWDWRTHKLAPVMFVELLQ